MCCLYFVLPCYNEEAVLPLTNQRLLLKVEQLIQSGQISPVSKIVYVNDGSKDQTWQLIQRYSRESALVAGIDLSRNRGHQNALLAGLMTVKDAADAVISMDADLQDDLNAVDEMLARFKQGIDVVYGVRSSRQQDTFAKRFTAELFYKFMNLLGAHTVFNHADFRLMSQKALNGLAEFKEVNIFLRGLVPLVGYSADYVYYERKERAAGTSKYTLSKMLGLAVDGITSMSIRPIRLIGLVGFFSLLVSLVMLIYSFVQHAAGNTQPGWTSLMISIWFLGGLNLLSLGVVGEYVGKTYLESKHRPRFLINRSTGLDPDPQPAAGPAET
ncbi:glycosyltransferase family 2 protein [Oscillospiraceae bacterium HV4-5-C5C]|nr:glycosyltransferase family 2 protein [Oscillospiraceae bacterium HV4-5-C5C]